MRIEKINDRQIRCTLNQKDLEDRELRVSELAYGTSKAKALFRDMMQQASYEFGFEAEDIPLMIEAIPLSPETLILIITKVEDPDELDSRFSSFTDDDFPEPEYTDEDYMFDEESGEFVNTIDDGFIFEGPETIPYTPTDDTGDFISLSEALGMEARPKNAYKENKPSIDVIKLFSFNSLQDLSCLAKHIAGAYDGPNQIYKDTKKDKYYLAAHQSKHDNGKFNEICNMITEYGSAMSNMYASYAYLEEHCELLLKSNALQTLADI